MYIGKQALQFRASLRFTSHPYAPCYRIRNYMYMYSVCMLLYLYGAPNYIPIHANRPNDVISYVLSGSSRAFRNSNAFVPFSRRLSSVVETRTHPRRPMAYGIDPENRTSGGNSFRLRRDVKEDA